MDVLLPFHARRRPALLSKPFNPADWGTVWTDLDPNALGLSDGDPIVQFTDQSGNGRHGTQPTSASRMTYRAGVLNGRGVAEGDGVDDVYFMPDASALSAATAFVVFKLDNDPPTVSQGGMWRFDSSPDASHVPYTDGTIYDAFGATVRKTVGNPTPSLASTYRIYEVKSAAGDWKCALDGTQLFSTGTNTTGFSTEPTFGGGDNPLHGAPSFIDGRIARFIMFSNALSDQNRLGVRSALQGIYAL